MILDDEGIFNHLQELEDESKAIRKEIGDIVVFLEGRVSWSEGWNMSRDDRETITESFKKYQNAIEKAMKR